MSAWVAFATKAAPQPARKSLYQRLGGHATIVAVTNDLAARLANDPREVRFVGLSTNSKKRTSQHIVDFLCWVSRGPCVFSKRDLAAAHSVRITDQEWTTGVRHLTAALNRFKVPQAEQQELLNAIASLKSQIVGR
jgi:hemoglobin